MRTPKTIEFSIDNLPEKIRSLLETASLAIRQSLELQTNSIIEIGSHLSGAKGQLDHGQFGAWVSAEFRFGMRTAEKYMNVYARLHEHSEIVHHLSPTTLYALASNQADKCRTKLIKEITSGKLRSDDEIMVRLAALLPKPEIDAEVESQRENNFGETVRLISVSVGTELPRLIELLRNIGVRGLADRLEAHLFADAQKPELEDEEASSEKAKASAEIEDANIKDENSASEEAAIAATRKSAWPKRSWNVR